MKVKKCLTCNKEFEVASSHNTAQKYCSKACKPSEKLPPKKHYCNKEFNSLRQQTYCTENCKQLAKQQRKQQFLDTKKEFICKFCNKKFTPIRQYHNTFCSSGCYKQYLKRFGTVKLICSICNKEFEVAYRFRKQLTCSKECAHVRTSITLNTSITKQCLYCNKDYSATQSYKDKAKYCSYDCFLKHKYGRLSATVIKNCEACGKEFEKSFSKRKVRFCSKSCANSGIFSARLGSISHWRGKHSWNYGLTTKTNSIVASLGKKISNNLKNQFKNGTLTNVGKNNPNYGNTRDTLSTKKLENFSKAASKRILLGQSGYLKNRITGKYFSNKTNTIMHFKSSWELAVMMWFDVNDNIKTYEYEPLILKLSNGTRAIPDFYVTYNDNSQNFIEVKPTAIQQMKHVFEKLELVKIVVKELGVDYVLFGNEMLDKIKFDLGDKFINAIKSYKNRG